jgi:hypothetical protein
VRSLALIVIMCACGDDGADVPKPFSGSLPENPRSCAEVRDQGSATSSQVVIAGAPAECVGEGVSCSVDGLQGFSGVCSSGVPNAVCEDQSWMLKCDLDAGTTSPVDAAADG